MKMQSVDCILISLNHHKPHSAQSRGGAKSVQGRGAKHLKKSRFAQNIQHTRFANAFYIDYDPSYGRRWDRNERVREWEWECDVCQVFSFIFPLCILRCLFLNYCVISFEWEIFSGQGAILRKQAWSLLHEKCSNPSNFKLKTSDVWYIFFA